MAKTTVKIDRMDRGAFAEAHLRGDLKSIENLLARIPELEHDRSLGDSWLHKAASGGHAELVKFWLDRGVPVDENVPVYSKKDGLASPLQYANSAEAARVLIEHGANVNAWNRFGGTPLHHAANRDDVEFVRVLLEAGADPGVVDAEGRTPLGVALFHKRKRSEKALRDAGAPEKGHKPAKQQAALTAPAIDLRKDGKKIAALLKKTVGRFAKEHPREPVTAVALAASGIEGYVMVAFDTKETRTPWIHNSSPWDASHSEFVTERFEDWQYAYDLAEQGVNITAIDGTKISWKKRVGDKKFQQPFFDACVAVLTEAAESGLFDKLNRAAPFTIGVEISSGDHSRFWELR